MKKINVILFALMFVITIAKAQTATDFTAVDCSSASHTLFTELNAGKVVVLCWVMPCSNCISGALTAGNVVQSYATSNPGRVAMYLCDDVGDTPCSALNTWATAHSITCDASFSNSAINMSDYGTAGMPKVVVIAGPSHTVYYNANFTIDATAMQNAINAGLTSGINEAAMGITALNVLPNPAANRALITFTLDKTSLVKADLFDIDGQLVKGIYDGKLTSGTNTITVNIAGISSGIYFAKFSVGDRNKIVKVVVAN